MQASRREWSFVRSALIFQGLSNHSWTGQNPHPIPPLKGEGVHRGSRSGDDIDALGSFHETHAPGSYLPSPLRGGAGGGGPSVITRITPSPALPSRGREARLPAWRLKNKRAPGLNPAPPQTRTVPSPLRGGLGWGCRRRSASGVLCQALVFPGLKQPPTWLDRPEPPPHPSPQGGGCASGLSVWAPPSPLRGAAGGEGPSVITRTTPSSPPLRRRESPLLHARKNLKTRY